MKHSGCVIAGDAALLLAVTSGTQAASDRISSTLRPSPPGLGLLRHRQFRRTAHALHALLRPGCGVGMRNRTSMMLPRAPFIDTRFASPKV
jgi:hypothetical protein